MRYLTRFYNFISINEMEVQLMHPYVDESETEIDSYLEEIEDVFIKLLECESEYLHRFELRKAKINNIDDRLVRYESQFKLNFIGSSFMLDKTGRDAIVVVITGKRDIILESKFENILLPPDVQITNIFGYILNNSGHVSSIGEYAIYYISIEKIK